MPTKHLSDIFLVTEDDYLKVLLPLLDSARKSVDIMAYSFAMASSAGRLDLQGGAL